MSQRITMTVALALTPIIASAAQIPDLPVPRGAAVILNTGSTNSAGYRIVVARYGGAEYVVAGKRQRASLRADVRDEFFAALSAAMPFPTQKTCLKSASFGSSTFVWWRGHRSGDISCPGATPVERLRVVVQKVADTLGVPTLGHIVPMLPHEPRRILTTAQPTTPTP